ncbi:MAG: hypothetical protein A2381_19545 [Bdellovibrionales bacterium RIFOXYB1_FULL_37_110]|nr:MAG: hypothetical protein A2417_11045 [Bdellovibrionales bacterium RIFOXYC1_FULL_37_79]OFZ60675.1 MAG: hypothetical protein A2381_19545 [Bdellovibrionales bacterium RIFOXYB1_FULL_37_110]OFZ64427.1 MAG: hypothetical protein A2577_10195 [Bdellovibrionales bacterium RIFOXYD1_FULL_36_51]
MNKPKFLILAGDGINCENETKLALVNANSDAQIVHINELLENPLMLRAVQGLALPGGFSFGDELGSGQVLSLKIKFKLKDHFEDFIYRGGAVIGICNGFQVLLKLGLLPDFKKERTISLDHNISGKFINKWVTLNKHPATICKWTTLLKDQLINLPIRHGEGRIVLKKNDETVVYNTLLKNGQIVFQYNENVNGAYENIAGICDPTGLILGLMPHPEAYLYEGLNHIHQKDFFKKGKGQLIFDSIVQYLKNS